MTTALVTGTSTGIGYETALKLAREGQRVFAAVRSEQSGEALVGAAAGLDVQLLVMDVDEDQSVADAIGGLLDGGEQVDVLVNNAGISLGSSVEETTLEVFQRVMNTNTWGTVRCIHAVLPAMRQRGSGCIINVTSVSGVLPSMTMSAYSMSKHAQESLTEGLAQEVAPFGIRVAAVEPGVIITPIFEKALSQQIDPQSPYIGSINRITRFFLSALGNPSTPAAVADTIWHAITTDEPQLRYLVGPDAEKLMGNRRRNERRGVAGPDGRRRRRGVGRVVRRHDRRQDGLRPARRFGDGVSPKRATPRHQNRKG